MVKNISYRLILAIMTLILLAGCTGIGPGTVARDRFDYVNAISNSWKRQMLLNLVKLRYVDAPVFLEVASIINQYAVEGEINLGANWGDINTQTLGGSGKYTDRPTITYSPLVGEKFYRSLMAPIPIRGLLFLIEADYTVDFLFRIGVQRINGIDNRSGAEMMARSADPRFFRLLAALRRIQNSGALGMRIKPRDKQQAMALFFPGKLDSEVTEDIKTVREILGLKPDGKEFLVFYGSLAENDREIAILTRSMLDIMVELGSYIEVPAKDVEEGRVRASPHEKDSELLIPPLIHIRSGESKPDRTFVSVHYEDYWFWIENTDFDSKRMFSFLMLLFSLTETGDKAAAPIVTVPTN